ncbi:MAG: hypothetical protein ACJ8BF_05110 [Gemmatimonadales bacterium]
MNTRTVAGLILSGMALASCGGRQSVAINPDTQPVASRWNGVLATPPELGGIVDIHGQGWMGPDAKEPDHTVAHVDISNAVPGAQHPWHVHRGHCGSDQGIFGPADAYPPLKVEGNGRAGATANLPLATPKTGDFFLNVHASSKNMKSIVACGNLAPPAR